jgi:uncharacterized membrane protein
MNIHPFFVHFALALLACYAAIELLCVIFRCDAPKWQIIRKFLLHTGVGFGLIAAATGGIAEGIQTQAHPELEPDIGMHESFVMGAFWLFVIAAFGYTVVGMSERGKLTSPFGRKLTRVAEIITKKQILFLISLVGIVAILIGGALGASITHGKDADFVVSMVSSMFF